MEKPKVGDIFAKNTEGGYAHLRIITEEPADCGGGYFRHTDLMYCPDGRLYSVEPSAGGDAESVKNHALVGHFQIGVPKPVAVAEEGANGCCGHASDCAVHNAPALPVGACDCGAETAAEPAECGECGHAISAHDPTYGCDVERGDGYAGGSDVIQALGPCGCTAVRSEPAR
jgi:hypothetical protein